MTSDALDAVTGAFGYTGRHIAARLLGEGVGVRTLTGHPGRPDPLREKLEVALLDFADPAALTESLRGVRTLYNTYWVRFPHGATTFERAVENSRILFAAARDAGVERIVHISITNPQEGAPLPYFRGKAAVEKILFESGVPHAVVRPTVIFGGRDIFVNNIAWLLRNFPVFLIPGSGRYPVQPVHVEDVARICLEGAQAPGKSLVMDAAGPETFTFEELAGVIRSAVGSRARFVRAPGEVARFGARMVGVLMRDVVLTREELAGLKAGLVVSRLVPRGRISFTQWARDNSATLGVRYASELRRHYRG